MHVRLIRHLLQSEIESLRGGGIGGDFTRKRSRKESRSFVDVRASRIAEKRKIIIG